MKKLLTIAIALGCMVWLQAQNSLTLRFTGKSDIHSYHIRMDSVRIMNITKNWMYTITRPDTTLVLTEGNGIEEGAAACRPTAEVCPNPFSGSMQVKLQLPDFESVAIQIHDINGKLHATYRNTLPAGSHTFTIRLAAPQTYLLSVATPHGSSSLKLVNVGNGGCDQIVLNGTADLPLKAIIYEVEHPFETGDQMRFVGYARTASSEGVMLRLSADTLMALTFNETAVLPVIHTNEPSDITDATAVSGGTFESQGVSSITSKGVCYDTLPQPTRASRTILNGAQMVDFTSELSGLTPNRTYYVKAFAENAHGTAYGEERTFRTDGPFLPIVDIGERATHVSTDSALISGNVLDERGDAVSERGFCWSTSPNPTISDDTLHVGRGLGAFQSSIKGLVSGSTYHVRAYATNAAGTGYSSPIHFITAYTAPEVSTLEVNEIGAYEASCGGEVIDTGTLEVTARGVCWQTSANPTIANDTTMDGAGLGTFTSHLRNLLPGTTYHVRAYAANSCGVSYGQEEVFTTQTTMPTVVTAEVTHYSTHTAVCGGTVTASGGATVTERGVCISLEPEPSFSDSVIAIGTGTGGFALTLHTLQRNATYYVRAYAINSVDTAFGETVSFALRSFNDCGTITDHEGNEYQTIVYGRQCWMKENMRCTTSPSGYTWNLNPVNGQTTSDLPYYAHLTDTIYRDMVIDDYYYNWNAATDQRTVSSTYTISGTCRGICPVGWHIPTVGEFNTMHSYVNALEMYNEGLATGQAKAYASVEGWNYPTDTDRPDVTGIIPEKNNGGDFNARPLGKYSYQMGRVHSVGNVAHLLTTDRSKTIMYSFKYAFTETTWGYLDEAYNVRCVRDVSFPVVATSPVTYDDEGQPILGGALTDAGNGSTAKGICWGTSPNPGIDGNHTENGTGIGLFSCQIPELEPNTTYYVRAYATNAAGTVYGHQEVFTTNASLRACGSPVTDHEGNTYRTILYDSQCWMRDNMRCTTSPSGTPWAANVLDTTYYLPYYAHFHGAVNGDTMDAYFYNWAAAIDYMPAADTIYGVQPGTPCRGICPEGWHVPSLSEWQTLIAYLERCGDYKIGGTLKKAMTTSQYWTYSISPSEPGHTPSTNNATLFSLPPAGDFFGNFYGANSMNFCYLGGVADLWIASRSSENASEVTCATLNSSRYYGDEPMNIATAVRCIKD